MILTLIPSKDEKYALFNAHIKFPSVIGKAAWAEKYITSEKCFATRLVAFAIVEGLFFSASFCALFWLKKRGLMPGLTYSNELISRDEGLHCSFACCLYSKLPNILHSSKVFEMIQEAVETEKQFVLDSLKYKLLGMNSVLMTKYVEFVADRLLKDLGYNAFFKTKNPFPWMDMISLEGKTNFFERRVAEYQKTGVMDYNSVPHLQNTASSQYNLHEMFNQELNL